MLTNLLFFPYRAVFVLFLCVFPFSALSALHCSAIKCLLSLFALPFLLIYSILSSLHAFSLRLKADSPPAQHTGTNINNTSD